LSIVFHIPGALREFTGGNSRVELNHSSGTLMDLLSELGMRYPGIRDRVMNEQGQVREHINIFIGNEHIRYVGGLGSHVADGSEVSIVPAVSGGMHYAGKPEVAQVLAR
jgi:sulfur-carrier protein